jgi:Flp pilus assembly protein TadD
MTLSIAKGISMRSLLALPFIVFLAGPAMAADACNSDSSDFDARIAACTAQIKNASVPYNRAAGLVNRGNANVGAMLFHRARRMDAFIFGQKGGQADAFETSHLDAAIRDFDEAISIFGDTPDAAIAFNDRGIAYGDRGDEAKAIEDYTHAIRLKPDYTGAYWNRALSYSTSHDHAKAIADFNRLIGTQPRNVDYLLRRADEYRDDGQFDKAEADYNQVLRIDPSNSLAKSSKETMAEEQKSHDDDMVQKCLHLARGSGEHEIVASNGCKFDVTVAPTNVTRPILHLAAGASSTLTFDDLLPKDEKFMKDSDMLGTNFDKVCRASDRACQQDVDADRAKYLAEMERDRRNAKYIDACQELILTQTANMKADAAHIAELTKTCEAHPDKSYCEAATMNIREAKPGFRALACNGLGDRASATPAPLPASAPSRSETSVPPAKSEHTAAATPTASAPANHHVPVAGKWLVIAGSWPDRGKAVARLALLKQNGVTARIVTTKDFPNLTSGLFAVVLGPFAKEDAEAQLPAVQHYVVDAFIKAGS